MLCPPGPGPPAELSLYSSALYEEGVGHGSVLGLLSQCRTEAGQVLTGRLCRHGETGVWGCSIGWVPPHGLSMTWGLGGLLV